MARFVKWIPLLILGLMAGPALSWGEQTAAQRDTMSWAWQDSSGALWVRLKEWARLWKAPSPTAPSADTLSAGAKVKVLEYDSRGFFRVQVDSLTGYLLDARLPQTKEVHQMVAQVRLREQAKVRAKEQAQAGAARKKEERRIAARKQALIDKYGPQIGADVFAGKVWIGMTPGMAKDSWGAPEDINRTVTAYGVHEQWVYPGVYLYFDGGVLTSFQD